MGKTSVTKEITASYGRALIVGKDITEASQESFFYKKPYYLATLFPYAEIFDNGEVTLKNNMGDFVTFS